MATLAKLVVELGLDDDTFAAGVDKSKNKLEEFGKKATEVGQKLTTAVTLPIVGVGIAAFTMASDLNESMSAVSTVFGTSGDAIIAWSANAATALGMSQAEALAAMASLGGMLTAMGLTGDQAAEMGQQVLGAAADLASFYNADPSETLAAIQSGLTGSYEPLRKYGIVLDEAAVQAKAMEMGLADANGEISEAAKVQARQALITEQMGAAQGDFARTSGSVANQMRILKAQFKDLLAQIGQKLLPIGLKAITWANDFAKRLQGLSGSTQKLVMIIAGVAAGIGPMLLIVGKAMQLGPALKSLASNIKLVGKALKSLIAGNIPLILLIALAFLLYKAYKSNFMGFGDLVRDTVKKVTAWLEKARLAFDTFRKYIKAVVDDGDVLNDWLSNLPKPLQGIALAVGKSIVWLMAFKDRINKVVTDSTKLFRTYRALGFSPLEAAIRTVRLQFLHLFGMKTYKRVETVIRRIITILRPFYRLISQGLRDAIKVVQALIKGDWAGAWSAFKTLVVNAVKNLAGVYLVIGQQLLDAFNAVDWGAVGQALWSALRKGAQWVANRVGTLWDEHKSQIQPLGEKFVGYVGLIGAKLWAWAQAGARWFMSMAAHLWDEHKNQIGPLADKFVGLLGLIGSKLWTWAKAGAKWFASMVGHLWDEHKAQIRPLAEKFVALLGVVGSKLWQWAKAGAKWFASMVAHLWDDHKAEIKDLAKRFVAFIGVLGSKLWEWAKSGAKWFISMVDRLWDTHKAEIKDLAKQFVGYIGVLGSKLWEWAKSGARWFGSMVGRLWDDHKSEIGSLAQKFVSYLPVLGSKIWEWAKAGAKWFASMVGMLWDAHKDTISELPGKFIATMGVIGSKLWEWAKAGASWFASMASHIWENNKTEWSALPGKLIDEIGELGSHLWGWLDDGVTRIINAVSPGGYIYTRLVSVGKSIGSVIKSAFDGALSGIGNWLINHLNDIIDEVNSWIEKINNLPGPDIPTIPRISNIAGASTTSRTSTANQLGSRVTPAATGTTNITINVNGAADPQSVANAVYATLARQMALREGM